MNSAIYPLHIYYESACRFCNAEITNIKLRNTAGLLQFTDVSAPGFVPQLPGGVTQADLLESIHAQRADGTVVKGVAVYQLAYPAVGLGWVAALVREPVMRGLANQAYRWIARIRHRIPRALVHLLFETVLRRAAQKAAAARCNPTTGCGA